jgi:hypothetical protein
LNTLINIKLDFQILKLQSEPSLDFCNFIETVFYFLFIFFLSFFCPFALCLSSQLLLHSHTHTRFQPDLCLPRLRKKERESVNQVVGNWLRWKWRDREWELQWSAHFLYQLYSPVLNIKTDHKNKRESIHKLRHPNRVSLEKRERENKSGCSWLAEVKLERQSVRAKTLKKPE